ncbi:MAG TPA: hypothetical protein VGT98_04000, partial [Candidatus Elarobacter sp.]|nr:hypothetical protein [Candidatus Elarobacter sp.]
FTAGFKDAAGPTLTVKSNAAFRVSVVATTATFAYSGAQANPNKPASDLKWGTVSGTYPNNAGTASLLFAVNTPATASATQQIFFRTLWALNKDVPGNYSLVVNFTLSAP